jgi:glutaredoxin 3
MNVTIYSTTTCSFCHVLYTWLDNNNIPFRKVLTDEDPAGMEEFMSVCDGAISVPLTVITDEHGVQTKITGLDRPKLKVALGL